MKITFDSSGPLFSGRSSNYSGYIRLGENILRSAHSEEKRSNTSQQFMQRQRMRHSIALWRTLKPCQPMFTYGKTNYNGFITLANRLPAVFMPKSWGSGATLLMPDMPVSDGSMTHIKQQLDEVNGTAALITNLKSPSLRPSEKLMLYTAEQRVSHGFPMVRCTVREVKLSEFVNLGGRLALVDHDFANEMKGWALVRVNGKRCSSQGIVTRCTYFEQFTTEEAYLSAAETYGGLTRERLVVCC